MLSKDELPDDLKDYVKLITDHQGNIRAFVVSLMPGSPDVADVVQETNAALWIKRKNFKHGTNFIAHAGLASHPPWRSWRLGVIKKEFTQRRQGAENPLEIKNPTVLRAGL